jgi:hypothetical protein
MTRTTRQIFLALSLISIAGSALAAERFSAASVRRSSGGDLTVSFREAYPLNLDVQGPGITPQKQLRVSYSDLYTIDRNTVRFSQREDGEWRVRSIYKGHSEILAIQESTVADQLLVLDSTSLSVIDFFLEEPKVIGSFPIDNRALKPGEHYIERFADSVYVIDSSLPGFRVLTVEDSSNIREVANFVTAAAPAEIRISSGFVFLLVRGELTVVSVKEFLAPRPEQKTTLRGSAGIRTLNFDGDGRGYLADGSNLRIVDMNPESPNFLQVESSLQMPTTIDQVLVQNGRAFVLDPTGALEIVDLSPRVQQQ